LIEEIMHDEITGIRIKVYRYGSGEPSILITSGIHGDETTSVVAALELIEYIESHGVDRGTVIIIPIVNPLGLRMKRRENPIDGKDINRVFPGAKDGSISEQIAYRIWNIATTVYHVLDLHCGGLNSIPYILALHKNYDYVREFTSKIPLDKVVESSSLRGQLFVEATLNKIPSALIEIPGGMGIYIDEYVHLLFETLKSLLMKLEIIKGHPREVEKQKYFNGYKQVIAFRDGIFKPYAIPGFNVISNTVIGSINDEHVRAECRGLLLSLATPQFISKGDVIARIALTENNTNTSLIS